MMDERIFTQQLLDSEQMLYRISCTLLRSEDDRRDAMQETALKAWQNRDKLREERYFKTWVSRILINECRNICRKSMRMIPMEEVPVPENADRQAADRDIRLMLEGLPERQRVPIVLHYLEGFSLEEIARVQHLTLSMVKYLMHQARKTLRLEMDGKEAAAK